MENNEVEKSTPHIISEIIEYLPKSIINRIILKKPSGTITASSFYEGANVAGHTIPFDTYIQIIDGNAELDIKGKNYKLNLGEGIIIPAHARHQFKAIQKFKMLSTIIKSGYED